MTVPDVPDVPADVLRVLPQGLARSAFAEHLGQYPLQVG